MARVLAVSVDCVLPAREAAVDGRAAAVKEAVGVYENRVFSSGLKVSSVKTGLITSSMMHLVQALKRHLLPRGARDDGNAVDAARLSALVFYAHLRPAVRPEVREHLLEADRREPACQLVGEPYGQRHERGRLGAGKAEDGHLVAGHDAVDLRVREVPLVEAAVSFRQASPGGS